MKVNGEMPQGLAHNRTDTNQSTLEPYRQYAGRASGVPIGRSDPNDYVSVLHPSSDQRRRPLSVVPRVLPRSS